MWMNVKSVLLSSHIRGTGGCVESALLSIHIHSTGGVCRECFVEYSYS